MSLADWVAIRRDGAIRAALSGAFLAGCALAAQGTGRAAVTQEIQVVTGALVLEASNGLDRTFALALNAQSIMVREFSTLTTPPYQAKARADFDKRLAKLKDDLEPMAMIVRDRLIEIGPSAGATIDAFEKEANALDRTFSRVLNAQDIMLREFSKLTTPPAQAEARAAFEARLAQLKTDLEPMAMIVRTKLLELEPPEYTLDPAKISDEANAAFLAKIDADPAYTRTASGLRYKPVKTLAEGRQPTSADEVTVRYKGTFIEGTEFDSSYKRNEPATFPLGKLIDGWIEGIPLMKVGETYEFVLPYDLAYGVWGRGSIPQRQTLVFQVELIAIADGPTATAPEEQPSEDDKPQKGAGDTTSAAAAIQDSFKTQVSRCWSPPVGASTKEKPIVKIQVRLNQDGSVMGLPEFLEPQKMTDPSYAAVAVAYRRAIMGCQNYLLPAESYELWQEFEVKFG